MDQSADITELTNSELMELARQTAAAVRRHEDHPYKLGEMLWSIEVDLLIEIGRELERRNTDPQPI